MSKILEDDLEEEVDSIKNNIKIEKRTTPRAPVYFYHPDHLGTATALTDFNGNAYQFFLNLPFGETMAEQLPSTYYKSPYKFNGKELDEETGLYYYGARYYDPKISLWLSVDPLADHPRQVGMSPYSAFWNNPIKYTDPDGRCPDCPNGEYSVQKGDNFWALEKKWNMAQGSLAGMNQGVDPAKLQIGQTINTTLSQTNLPAGVSLHSPLARASRSCPQ